MPVLPKIKHEKFAQEIIRQDGNQTDAYCKIYKKTKKPLTRTQAYKILRHNPQIKERVAELLELQGVDLPTLNDKLRNMLDAKRIVVTGAGDKTIEVADNSTQMDALKLGYKIHGITDNNQGNTNIDNRSINITMSSEDLQNAGIVVNSLSNLNEKIGFSKEQLQDGEVI